MSCSGGRDHSLRASGKCLPKLVRRYGRARPVRLAQPALMLSGTLSATDAAAHSSLLKRNGTESKSTREDQDSVRAGASTGCTHRRRSRALFGQKGVNN